jgi:hypothetical protein
MTLTACGALDRRALCANDDGCPLGTSCSAGFCALPADAPETPAAPFVDDGVLVNALADGRPFAIERSDAPQCIEIAGSSVYNYDRALLGDARQSACNGGGNQRFWAVARGDGFFGLQNARSARCLDVEKSSLEDGANVAQFGCHFKDNQLWSTVEVGEGRVSIVNKASGKVLDVLGDSFTGNGNATGDLGDVQQRVYDGSPDQQWRLRWTSSNAYVGLETFVGGGRAVRFVGGRVVVDTDLDDDAGAFHVVPGLAHEEGVSFEVKERPGLYLARADDGTMVAFQDDGTEAFFRASTFYPVDGLQGEANPIWKSFESFAFPGSFLVAQDGVLRTVARQGDAAYAESATFAWRSRD